MFITVINSKFLQNCNVSTIFISLIGISAKTRGGIKL